MTTKSKPIIGIEFSGPIHPTSLIPQTFRFHVDIEYRFGEPYADFKERGVSLVKRAFVEIYLLAADGKVSAAAKLAKMDRGGFKRLMKECGR